MNAARPEPDQRRHEFHYSAIDMKHHRSSSNPEPYFRSQPVVSILKAAGLWYIITLTIPITSSQVPIMQHPKYHQQYSSPYSTNPTLLLGRTLYEYPAQCLSYFRRQYFFYLLILKNLLPLLLIIRYKIQSLVDTLFPLNIIQRLFQIIHTLTIWL